MKIPIAKPYIDEKEKEAVGKVLDSGWLVQGSMVRQLEKMMCDLTGSRYAKASTSCTTSLHLALLSLGIGPEYDVLLPSFTMVATANVIEYVGAKPVFIDINLDTFNIDTGELEIYLEKNKSGRKLAIIPVHLFGLMADMTSIIKLAKNNNMPVIEDAACALGSLDNSRNAGTIGDAGCFSFHPRKSITTGEGGMLITDSEEIAMRVESLRDFGAVSSDFERHQKEQSFMPDYSILGYNFRMTDIQAAIGIEQMKKFPWILNRRIELARNYNSALQKVECLKLPLSPDEYKHTYQSYVVLLQKAKTCKNNIDNVEEIRNYRDTVMAKLGEKGISTRQGTTAVHRVGYYKKKYGLKENDCPCSFIAESQTITLPLYPQMTEIEQSYVIDNLIQILREQ